MELANQQEQKSEWPKIEEALGWLSNFKKRNNIKEYYKAGEVASVPIEDLLAFRSELQVLISQYELDDVFNADKTGLYWKLEPNKLFTTGLITGTIKIKR
ncbi:9125_t:CDS:2 [Diversispora eburnea]|uniref:9125_t:CDS:1 n=1 Tax=Diversispora eburnea TaxID=1213867 RepID=A0A9N8YUG9_9GLOM|nr:9125_t:CDS:2 [Diversispora eburnea]